MRAVPKSQQAMLGHLEELKRKENLELLREPLIEYNLFPYDKDPHTATITVEELKKLVRHWKLHEARGFWKTHSEKEDLMRALLDYMHHHNLYNNRTPAAPAPQPKRPEKSKGRPRPAVNHKRVLKPYQGDLFGRFDNSDGLLYLSRMNPNQKLPDRKNREEKTKEVKALNTLGTMFAPPPDHDSGASTPLGLEGEDRAEALRQISGSSLSGVEEQAEADTKVSVAERLYQFTISKGSELAMVNEGVLHALAQVLSGSEDFRIDFYVAAALLNLSVAPEAREAMVDRAALHDCLALVLSSPAAEATTAQFAAKALYNLSCRPGLEDRLMAVAQVMLTSLVGMDNEEVRYYACAAAVNLFPCLERHRLVDPMIPALTTLAAGEGGPAVLRLVGEVIYRMAYYEYLRTTMVDLSIVPSLGAVAAREGLPLDLCVLLASALANLSRAAEARDKMVRTGAVPALERLAHAAVEEEGAGAGAGAAAAAAEDRAHRLELRRLIATALCNLSANEKLGSGPSSDEKMKMDQAVPTLVEVGLGARDLDLKVKVAGALANLTLSQNLMVVERMVAQGAPRVLMELVTTEHDASRPVEPTAAGEGAASLAALVVGALCNLLYDAANHAAMVQQGILETLTAVLERERAPEVARIVARAFANLSGSAEHADRFLSSGLVAAVIALAEPGGAEGRGGDPDVQRTALGAFGYLSALPPVGQVLMGARFVATASRIGAEAAAAWAGGERALAQSQAALQRQASDDNLRADDAAALEAEGRRLEAAQGERLALMTRVADVLSNLSLEEAHCVPLIEQGGLECALKFCAMDDSGLLARCSSILCRMSMANVRGHEVRQGLSLLEQKSSDKDVLHSCSLAMFAMSCQPDVVDEMTQDPVMLKRLISLMREGTGMTQAYSAKALCNLSRQKACARILLDYKVVDDLVVIALLRSNSDEIKEICSQSLFNLLVHEESRPEMVAKGVVWALCKLARQDSQRTQAICAQTLYNLSFQPATAQVLVDLGMVAVAVSVVLSPPEAEVPTQRHLATALVNLCRHPPYARRLACDDLVRVLGAMAGTGDEPVLRDATAVLRLLCRPEVGPLEAGVARGAVKVLQALARARPASRAPAAACAHHLTGCPEVRRALMAESTVGLADGDDQLVARFVIALLAGEGRGEGEGEGEEEGEEAIADLGLAALLHLSYEEGSCAKLAAEGAVGAVAGVVARRGQAKVPMAMRVLESLSHVAETHAQMVAAGVAPLLVAALVGDPVPGAGAGAGARAGAGGEEKEKEKEKEGGGGEGKVEGGEGDGDSYTEAGGAGGEAAGADAEAVRASAAAAVRNLSFTAEACEQLLAAGLLAALARLLPALPAGGGAGSVLLQLASALRNASCVPALPAVMAEPGARFLGLLKGMAERGGTAERDHLAYCLVNLVLSEGSKAAITDQGGPAVLSYLANNVSSDEVKQMCAAAIASQSNRSANEFVEGSVIALMSIIDQPGGGGSPADHQKKSEPKLNVDKCLRPLPPPPHPGPAGREPAAARAPPAADDTGAAGWETFTCELLGVVFCSVAEARRKAEPQLCELVKPIFTQTHGEFTKLLLEVGKMDANQLQAEMDGEGEEAGDPAQPPPVPETPERRAAEAARPPSTRGGGGAGGALQLQRQLTGGDGGGPESDNV